MKKRFSILLAWLAVVSAVSGATLQRGEYFIDTDPGPGLGTAFYTGTDTAYSGTVTLPPALLSGLSEGLHDLVIRFRDSDDKWGPAVVHRFEVKPLTAPLLTAAEYF